MTSKARKRLYRDQLALALWAAENDIPFCPGPSPFSRIFDARDYWSVRLMLGASARTALREMAQMAKEDGQ